MISRVIRSALIASTLASMSWSPAHAASHGQHRAPKFNFTMPNGWPKRLMIPTIGVNATVESLSMSKPADLHAPYQWGDVAWYNRGARPGQIGKAAIFGHLDSTCCPAVFYHLRDLKKGNIIEVQYKAKTLRFRVLWQGTYLNAKLPLKFLFGPSTVRGLGLFTCAGVFHRDGTGYDHKLLVYARMILPNGKLG